MTGKCVSHYRILEKLGAGGMGEVYAAEDTLLARRVAIKFPSLRESDGEARGRFLEEARVASRLDHPNFARVYDYGEADDGRPFLVMELVNGTDLREQLQRGPLSPAKSVEIAASVLRGLGEAHRSGLIHRDIKPANVMVTEAGDVKVLDLGLAKQIPTVAADRLAETATVAMGFSVAGVVRGTPQYMSPEQVRGGILDPRTDLFSIGLLLYECLTGGSPFPGASANEVLNKILYEEPPAPSSRTAGIPGRLDRIIAKALAKDPKRRYQSAEEMLEDVTTAEADLKSSGWLRAVRAARSRRYTWPAAAASVLLLVPGYFFWRSRPHEPPAGAVLWYQRGAMYMRDGTYYRAAKALEKAVELDPEFVLAHARLAEARNELDDSAGAGREMLAAMPAGAAGAARGTAGLQVDAIRLTLLRDFAGAIGRYTELSKSVPDPEKAAVFVDLGRVHEMNQEIPKALEAYREAIRRDPENAAAHLRTAILLGRLRQPEESAEFVRAESLYQTLGNTEGQVEVLYQRGYLISRPGTLGEARAQLEKANELARTTSSEQQEIASALQLSIITSMEGDDVKAGEMAARAAERARGAGMNYLAARGLANLGASQLGKHDYKRAEASFQDALQLSRRWQMRRSEARALFSLANLHQTTGSSEAALKEIEPALAYYRGAGFKLETVQCLTVQVRANRDLGKEADAMAGSEQLLSLASAAGDRTQMAIVEQGMANLLQQKDDWPNALEHFRRYYEIAKSIPNSDAMGRSLVGQAGVLWRLGRYPDAERELKEADTLAAKSGSASELPALIAERRAGMALSRGRYREAMDAARRIYESPSAPPVVRMLMRCLAGVAAARSGSARLGQALCDPGITAMVAQMDRFSLAEARLSTAEILVANGNALGGLEQARQAAEVSEAAWHKELSWRAWVIAARACERTGDRAQAKTARENSSAGLAELQKAWGAENFRSYTSRDDIRHFLADLSHR
jgi:tetratricopeptide (TPR) repeat protein